MVNKKKCEECIWFDQCGDSKVCDSYEPASEEEQGEIDIAEYEDDLHMRHEYYQKNIVEHND